MRTQQKKQKQKKKKKKNTTFKMPVMGYRQERLNQWNKYSLATVS